MSFLRFICTDDTFVKWPAQLLAGNTYHVGRSSKCAFVVRERSVSRVHAELKVQEQRVLVRDLDSRNGIYVEGEKVVAAALRPGQRVHFGSVMFHLVHAEKPHGGNGEEISHASTHIVLGKQVPFKKQLDELSQAQLRVLELLKKGLSEREAAAQLNLSAHTVHNHVKVIYRVFNVNTRPELLALFVAEDGRTG